MNNVNLVRLKTASHVYVLCPGGLQTGGPELLHQLVFTLSQLGKKASIVYYPLDLTWQTVEAYQHYKCPQASIIPDEEGVAVVVPEVVPYLLKDFKKATCVIWWLSVDNYRGNFDTYLAAGLWLKKSVYNGFKNTPNTIHLFQSEYAKNFVAHRFGSDGLMLSDYVAHDYSTVSTKTLADRTDTIIYNPRKGFKFTTKIRRALPNAHWLALEKMTRDQVRAALESAKVYIDFGTHPGKDRIPREAAMSGCIVIVGLQGSARFEEDVSITKDYKFPVAASAIPRITQMIKSVMMDYDGHYLNQSPYRVKIQAEKALFNQQVADIFL